MKDSAIPNLSAAKALAAGGSSAALKMAGAFLLYVLLENWLGVVQLAVLVAGGLLIGCLLGAVAGGDAWIAIGVGAFGLVILWIPVIFLTYGFALMYLPLMALHALFVAWSAKFSSSFLQMARR